MDKELIEHIKNQVIDELKKDYFLIKKTGEVDVEVENASYLAKNKTLVINVVEIACELFKMKRELLLSDTRKREYTDVRYMIFIVCRQCFKYPIPLSQIAEPFKKNHSSVLHGYNRGLDYARFNKKYESDLNSLKQLVIASLIDKK